MIKREADSTEEDRAPPVVAADLLRIKEHLPTLAGGRQQRYHTERLFLGYALLVLMLQGLLRKGDLQYIRRERIKHYTMHVGDDLVRFYVIKFKDKPRIGTLGWRHVTIVERNDDLDSYAFLRQALAERGSGLLLSSRAEPGQLVDKIIKWTRRRVPGLAWIRAHGLRAGGLLEMEEVIGSNVSITLLQGGWRSHSTGNEVQRSFASSARKYLRTNPSFLRALLTMGRPQG